MNIIMKSLLLKFLYKTNQFNDIKYHQHEVNLEYSTQIKFFFKNDLQPVLRSANF